MSLTPDQLRKVLESHCSRVIDAMSIDELKSYASRKMAEEFDQNPGVGDVDILLLMGDIVHYDHIHNDDIVTSREFLIGCGVTKEDAENLIQQTF